MKMTSSTSSTSIIGVMFMSLLTSSFLPVTMRSAPKCMCACAMSVAPRLSGPDLAFGDEAHVLDSARAELIHGIHDRRVLGILVGLDEHDSLLLGLEDVRHLDAQLLAPHRNAVDEEPVVLVDGDDRLILRLW